MRDPESDLDALLRSAAPTQPDAATEERVLGEVWARLETAMAAGAWVAALGGGGLPLTAARGLPARRRRRAARLASATLAVVIAGGGTAAAATGFLATHTGSPATGIDAAAAGSGE